MQDDKDSKRLLIVDDALIIRRRIAEIASEVGWQIAEARDGAEAVEVYRKCRPELVTLDIVMPNMDGVQTLKSIREMDASAQVVMVSAVNQKEKLEECIREGAIDFIVKPFDAPRLRAFFERRLYADNRC